MVSPRLRSNHSAPDRFSEILVRSIFLVLGIGALVPWNAFISAKDYYVRRIVCGDKSADYHNNNLESTFAVVFNGSALFSVGLIMIVQWIADQKSGRTLQEASSIVGNHGNENDDRSSDHSFWLVTVPYRLFLVAFTAQSFMVLLPDLPEQLFSTLTMASVALCAAFSSIVGAGVVATAGLFDPHLAMNPYLEGQALGGVGVSLANFLAACWEDPDSYLDLYCNATESNNENVTIGQQQSSCQPYDDVDWAVFPYFFLGSLIFVACLVGYAYIARLRDAGRLHIYEAVQETNIPTGTTPEASPCMGLELSGANVLLRRESSDGNENHGNSTAGLLAEPALAAQSHVEESKPPNESMDVFLHIRGPLFCIFMTFVVTLALFPGRTSELHSLQQCKSSFRLANDLYTPLTFLLFNVGDLFGRMLCAQVPLDRVKNLSKKLVVGSILRLVFFPLLFFCYAGQEDSFYIPSDVFSILVQFLFATTNGFFLSCAFVHAPTLLPRASDVEERMSELLQLAVVLGLLAGSLVSVPVSKFTIN